MTTTPSRAQTPAEDTGPAPGLGRVLMGVITALGPLLYAVAFVIQPYGTADSSKEIARKIATHQTATQLTVWGWMLGSIALVAGTVVVGLLAMRYRYKLGLWGLLVFGTGVVAVTATPSMDAVALGGFDEGVSQETLIKVADGLFALPVVAVPTLYFVVAHVVGAILLGVALLRGRVIPAWAAWVLILSMPLNVVGYAGGIMPVTALSFVMLAIGFGAAGLAVTRHGIGWTRAT